MSDMELTSGTEPGAPRERAEKVTGVASDPLQQVLVRAGFATPSPVQAELVPAVMSGADVVVRAPAGTGRVAGLSMAAAQLLEAWGRLPEEGRGPSLLLMGFAVEDVQQAAVLLEALGQTERGVVTVQPGARADRVASALRRGPSCVLGTIGRIGDLVAKEALDVSCLRTVMLLEADLALGLGAPLPVEGLFEAIKTKRDTELQTVLAAAELTPALARFIEARLEQPRSLEFPAVEKGLAGLAPKFREVAEDEKTDLVAELVAGRKRGQSPVVVVRHAREQDQVRAACAQRGIELSAEEVVLDGTPDVDRLLGGSRRGVSLHLPLDPAAWAAAPLSRDTALLVTPGEYWDLARLGLRADGVSAEELERPRPKRERRRKTKEAAAAPEAVAEGDESSARSPLTEAERLQRRYVQRDAARKIERIDPEDASKEAARLVRESLLEAAFQQAFASSAAESALSEDRAGEEARERRRAEIMRRREVDERLREAKRRLQEHEGLSPEPVSPREVAPAAPAPPAAAGAGEVEPLSTEELRLVTWARTARERLAEVIRRASRRPEYAVLADHLLEGASAGEVVAALLEALVPLPGGPATGSGGMVRLFLSVGRAARVTRDQIEELLEQKAGVGPGAVGRIDVLSRYTFLEVREDVADTVIDRLSGVHLRGRDITVARARPPRNGYGEDR